MTSPMLAPPTRGSIQRWVGWGACGVVGLAAVAMAVALARPRAELDSEFVPDSVTAPAPALRARLGAGHPEPQPLSAPPLDPPRPLVPRPAVEKQGPRHVAAPAPLPAKEASPSPLADLEAKIKKLEQDPTDTALFAEIHAELSRLADGNAAVRGRLDQASHTGKPQYFQRALEELPRGSAP